MAFFIGISTLANRKGEFKMTKEEKKISAGKIIATFMYILIFPALLLFLSGDWFWIEGWIFSVWYATLCFATILHLYRNDPSLLAERYKRPGTGNQKGWDVYVVYGIVAGFVSWIVIIPLDAKKFGWTSNFPLLLQVIGGFILLFSYFFFYRSYSENSFASALVRIQEERKQQVISTGVYGIVRHPMYLGGALLFVGAPLLMGSLYGVSLGFLLSFLLAGRIIGEEKMLVNELDGYADYQKKIKYRLIPFVW
jgi:protein-S-isoprenylcysteine O-methyltransferase Ste14